MKNNLGMGVMLSRLSGRNGAAHFAKAVGKEIKTLVLDEDHNQLKFEFTDGSKISMWDDGQSCCENRYMRTDDSLSDYVGGILEDAELRDAPDGEDNGETHEVQFLVIKTSQGQFTLSNHNEHNGYYGGFAIVVSEG